jgi:hypothetical protein
VVLGAFGGVRVLGRGREVVEVCQERMRLDYNEISVKESLRDETCYIQRILFKQMGIVFLIFNVLRPGFVLFVPPASGSAKKRAV